jgi:transposase
VHSKLDWWQVVEETMRPGAPSVPVIARVHGVNANQVFNWRKLYRAGHLSETVPATELLPVLIGESSPSEASVMQGQIIAHSASGTIHIDFSRARIRVEGSVDPENLRTILEQLGQ